METIRKAVAALNSEATIAATYRNESTLQLVSRPEGLPERAKMRWAMTGASR